MPEAPLWTKHFILVSLANFFMFSTFYALLVTLPSIAVEVYGVSESIAGLYTTLFLLAAIFIRFFIGTLMKFATERILYISSYVIFTFASFIYLLSDHYLFVLGIRFIHGLGFGLGTTIAAAIVSRMIPPARKGEGMGYFVTSSNVAMVLGPFFGLTILQHYNEHILFLIMALSATVALLITFVVRVESAPPITEEEATRAPFKKETTLFEKRAVPISFMSMYLAIPYSAVTSFLALFALGQGLEHVANYFFTTFAVVLILSRPFTGKWFDNYGPNVVIFPAIVIFALGQFSLGMSQSAFLLLTAAGLIGLSWGTLFSSLQTVAIQSTTPQRASIATATYFSMLDFGVATGAFVVGLLVNKLSLSLIYTLFSLYIILSLPIYYIIQKRYVHKQRTENQEHIQVK